MGNEKKAEWLNQLAQFIVEANRNTWAADAPVITPQRPGYKEVEYPSPQSNDNPWYLRDSYTGYFAAPGMTTVYYKDTPVWSQSYGGEGMIEEYYHLVKPTFDFLKEALKRVTPESPFRGPYVFGSDDWEYTFLQEGDIEHCEWDEFIAYKDEAVFTQTGFAGLILPKNHERQVVYPWDL